jgi:hypothetical protein
MYKVSMDDDYELVVQTKLGTHYEEWVVTVVIRATDGHHGPTVAFHKWEELPSHTFVRFMWYFKYRAALVRVKYPKAIITFNAIREDRPKKDILEMRVERAKKSCSAAKGQLTKVETALKEAKDNWKEIFPIEQHPKWKRTIEKVKEKRQNYFNACNEYMKAVNELNKSKKNLE